MTVATIATQPRGSMRRESLPTREPLEREVVARARNGDHEAFRVLVERHQPRVYGLALRILREEEAARDAAQGAFLKAYRALRKFEGRSSFGTWMFRLTYNHCLDILRRAKSDPSVAWDEERFGSLDEQHPSRTPDPATELDRNELREQLGRALSRLPERSRQVLILRELHGFSYAEIASTLSIPKGTVMSRLFHARRQAREVLSEMGITSSGVASSEGRGAGDPI